MESPDKYYTNVFKVENLARIPYRVFVPNIRPERHGSLEYDRPLWTRYAQALRLAEKYLREKAIVAYVDYEENEAWIFDIPIPAQENMEVQNVPFEAFVQLGLAEPKTSSEKDKPVPMEPPLKEFPPDCGMVMWKEGTFLASSLNPPPPIPPRTPVTIDLTGTDDGKTDEGSEEDTPERVWQFFIGAILSTLSYQMCSTAKFIPLNLRDHVSLPHVQFPEPDEEVFADELWYSEYFGKIICSLDVHLASSGILCVTASSQLVKGLGQLIHTLDDNNFIPGRSIWLAPWGQVGQVVTVLSEKELTSYRAQEWKRNVQEYLESKGLRASTRREFGLDGPWLRVNIKREDIDGNGHEEETLWPAALCFVREQEGDKTLFNPPGVPSSIGFALNPLAPIYRKLYKDVHDPEGQEEDEMKRLEEAMKELFEEIPEEEKHGLKATSESQVLPLDEDPGLGWFEYEGNVPPDPLGAILKFSKEHGPEAVIEMITNDDNMTMARALAAAKKQGKGKEKEVQPSKETPAAFPTPSAVYPTPSTVYPTPPTASHQPTTRQEGKLNNVTNVASSSGQMDLDQDEWLGGSAPSKAKEDLEDDVLEDLMEGGAFVTDKDFDFFDEPHAPDGDADLGLDTLDFESMSTGNARSPDADISMSGMAPGKDENAPTVESSSNIYQDGGYPPSNPLAGFQVDVNHVQTPPLSPHHAMTLLIPEYSTGSQQTQHISPLPDGQPSSSVDQRKGSLYAPMNFLPNVEMADKKYQAGGRFYVPPEEDIEELEKSTTKISLDSPINANRSSNIHTPTPRFADFTPGTDRSHRVEIMGYSSDESDSPSEEYASSSGHDSNAEDEYFGPGKRKRRQEDIDGMVDSDEEEDLAQNISELLPWQLLIPDPNDASLVDVFNTLDLQHLGCSDLVDSDYIGTSRIVAEQLMGSFIQPLWRDYSIGTNDNELEAEILGRKITDESIVYTNLIEIFPQVLKCTVESYAAITDAIPEPLLLGRAVNRPVPLLRRPPPLRTVGSIPSGTSSPTTESPPAPSIFRIEPPHVHVHRGEFSLDILPASLNLWETFSFAPCVGPKNVFGICVYPEGGKPMVEGVDAFLENVGPLYDACRLGFHILANLPASHYFPEIKKGRVSWNVGNPPSVSSAFDSLRNLSGELGIHLTSIADEGQNIVIYVINPFKHPAATAEISRAFMRLKRSYRTAMENTRRRPNNIVLQIIPINLIVSPDSIVVLPFEKARVIAMEVYQRCSLSLERIAEREYAEPPPTTPFAANAPIYIVRPLASAIEFKLTAEPSPALLMENSMMHVAYARSIDDRWIVAAWSDNWGKIKRTESYCLARRGHQPFRTFSDVYKEIWKATMEVIRFKNVHWRLIFTKVGLPVTEDEVEEWTQLQGSPVGLNFAMRTPSVIILSCTLQPDLSISMPVPPLDWSEFGLPNNVDEWPKEPPPDLVDMLKDMADDIQPRNNWKARSDGSGIVYAPKSIFEVLRQVTENRRKAEGSSDNKGKNKAAETEKKPRVLPWDPSTWPEIDQADLDATKETLIDVNDETWGVVLNHKTPHSAALTEFGPITTTAYQVCRGSASGQDRPAVIQFNIVHWSNVNTTATTCAQNEQALAREILEGWRGLRFLDWGERRGCPWHIAAVDRGIQIGEVM